jgi:pilus assembly protein CpaD
MTRSLRDIQRHVTNAGIDYQVLPVPRASARTQEIPAITLAYKRPVAVPPVCDHWEHDVGRNEERIPYPNWGCATQRNTALMVDNARDFRQPQPEDPRSSERRGVTWSAYVGSGGAAPDGGGAANDSAKKAQPATTK